MKKLTISFAKKVFRSFLTARNLNEQSIYHRLEILKKFLLFIKEKRGVHADLREVRSADIESYLAALHNEVSVRTGRPLGETYKQSCIFTVKMLFNCLYVNDYLLTNPLQGIRYKKSKEGGKRAILSSIEMGQVLDGINLKAKNGLRDRAIFELMYGSGLRIEEARKLRVTDLDFERRMVFVHGKGGKPRLQPVSEAAFLFLKNYLAGRETKLDQPVFRGSSKGGLVSKSWLNERFKMWVRKAGIKRNGVSTHSIRHSVATHLLENGANIRYVQSFLDHESIKTTTVYTHTLYENLKRIYKSAHPRENEFYKEVDTEYREQIAAFKRRLEARKRENEKRAAYFKAYYEKKSRS